MTQDDIIRMAREARWIGNVDGWTFNGYEELERFAAQVAAAEREVLANWMRQHGFITGQTYTTDSLLDRLGTEMVENTDAAVIAEREACAYECEVRDGTFALKNAGKFFADIIRARGEV